MNDVRLPRRPFEAPHPAKQLPLVCMGGQSVNGLDLRTNGDVTAVNADEARAFLERTSSCSSRLIADQQYGVSVVGQSLLEVVQDAPSCRHAAPGDDHDWPFLFVQSL
jgi:hypothetical protein